MLDNMVLATVSGRFVCKRRASGRLAAVLAVVALAITVYGLATYFFYRSMASRDFVRLRRRRRPDSQTVMRRFGGDVRLVDSQVGVGSCFEIVFAVADWEES